MVLGLKVLGASRVSGETKNTDAIYSVTVNLGEEMGYRKVMFSFFSKQTFLKLQGSFSPIPQSCSGQKNEWVQQLSPNLWRGFSNSCLIHSCNLDLTGKCNLA